MNLFTRYQSKLSQFWPEIERFFGDLPPNLFRQGVQLKNNLATFYSNTGQFQDILQRDIDPPLLYLHFWLLDDWHIANTPQRAALEKHLFLSTVFSFAATYTRQTILDAGSNFDSRFAFLEQALNRQAHHHLSCLFSANSPFWQYHNTLQINQFETALNFNGFQRSAFSVQLFKIPVFATATALNKEAALPQLTALMDNLNFVWQTLQDLSNLRRDLLRRNFTGSILKIMQAGNIAPHAPGLSKRVLGAAVLTNAVDEIGQECFSKLAACRNVANEPELVTFAEYFDYLEILVGDVTALFSLKARPGNAQWMQQVIVPPVIDTLPKVIEMAEGYLLADPTFKESWEVQRRGVFGVPEIVGKAFSAGLITEILCQHNHSAPDSVNFVFDTLQSAGFRYYNDAHLPPDTDDLALLLRLYPYSVQPDAHRQLLQNPLRLLQNNINNSGEIPVWLVENEKEKAQRQVRLWGNSCAAVEANMLLGLLAFDEAGYSEVIAKSAGGVFDRWINKGFSATLHYVPLYSLWVTFDLIYKLAESSLQGVLRPQIEAVTRVVNKHLDVEMNRAIVTPQDAAFLLLITAIKNPTGLQDLLGLVNVLCKNQRYDGSWAAEPLFGTPTRGELAAWYGSRSVTTAFCYHALKTCRQ